MRPKIKSLLTLGALVFVAGIASAATAPRRPKTEDAAIAGVAEQISMPISQFLGNSKFDPETKRIMGLAFEMTRVVPENSIR